MPMHRHMNVPTEKVSPQKSSLKRVNCHRLKKNASKIMLKWSALVAIETKNASVITPKNCVKDHAKSGLRQRSFCVTVLCVNISASEATPPSTSLKITASEIIAIKIICVNCVRPLIWWSLQFTIVTYFCFTQVSPDQLWWVLSTTFGLPFCLPVQF